MKTLHTLPRIIVGLLFVYASVEKIMTPDAFAVSVANYDLLPSFLIGPIALWLPWLEMLTGIMLITGRFALGAATTASGLMVIFCLAISISYLRGLNINCGCFSMDPKNVADMRLVLLRDVGILTLCLIALSKALSQNKKTESS